MPQMHEPVVVTAEQHRVGQRCLSTLLPEDDVVDVAVLGRPVAAGADAGAVAGGHCPAQGGRDGAGGAPDVHHLGRDRPSRSARRWSHTRSARASSAVTGPDPCQLRRFDRGRATRRGTVPVLRQTHSAWPGRRSPTDAAALHPRRPRCRSPATAGRCRRERRLVAAPRYACPSPPRPRCGRRQPRRRAHPHDHSPAGDAPGC